MKKLFTLALALLVATMGFSQVQKTTMSRYDIRKNTTAIQKAPRLDAVNGNFESEPVMTSTRDLNSGDLDYTTYDWQTNHAAINRTIVWPDGKVNFAYTLSNSNNYNDRGTGIGTYDSNTDEWIPLEGRIEAEKTGFGSIARYGENGIVVAAHTASDTKIYIVEDKDNMTPNSVTAVLNIGTDIYTHPCVMTSGPNRDIIHMVCSEFEDGDPDGNGIEHGIRYYRSSDGENWDIVCRELPYLTIDYGTEHGGNCYYWMETTEDNCLALVINTGNTDGMVLYSYDDGDTWERKIYFHDPAPGYEFGDDEDGFFYPRWTSAQWNDNMELMLAYEINASSHSGTYSKVGGGVAFWSEYMPYRGTGVEWGFDPTNPMPPVHGQPFIMDSAYLFEDLYGSLYLWSEPTHEMWPEYIGYFANLDEDGNWEDPEAEEWQTEFHHEGSISTLGDHGSYNGGAVMQPALCKVNGNDNELVAVWAMVDDEHKYNGMFFFKLMAAYSLDGGLNWSHMVGLTAGEFEFMETEQVYPQIAVIGNTLIVAAQVDYEPGTNIISSSEDTDPSDSQYKGFTFSIADLFSFYDSTPETVCNNVHMDIFPNPAVDRLNITLSKNAEIVVYNIMGQKVMSQEGHAGANSINVSSLTSGVYFVNAGSDTQKFIVK